MSMKRYDAGFHTDKVHPHVTGIFVLYTDAEQLERVADGLNAALLNMLALSRRDGMNWGPANADAQEALASYAKWKEK